MPKEIRKVPVFDGQKTIFVNEVCDRAERHALFQRISSPAVLTMILHEHEDMDSVAVLDRFKRRRASRQQSVNPQVA